MTAKQVRAQYTREFKLEAVRQARGSGYWGGGQGAGYPQGQSRQLGGAKRPLSGVGDADKAARVSPEQMEIARLRAEAARLRMVTSQKSRSVLRAGHAVRYAWIHQMRSQCPVSISCGVLEVSASGYFNWLRRPQDMAGRAGGREAVLAHIRDIHAEVKGEYGWLRRHKELLAR